MSTYYFFFQAEDGIRDRTVTGVQTCALPIWRHGNRENRQPAVAGRPLLADRRACVSRGRQRRSLGRCRRGFAHAEAQRAEIGRASCRERVKSSVGTLVLEEKQRALSYVSDSS